MSRCIVASWVTADETYGAYIYTETRGFAAVSGSLRLLAEACEATAKDAIEALGETFDRASLEHHWLGLLADTTPSHVGEIMAAHVTPPNSQN
jgi:hypothetical protein